MSILDEVLAANADYAASFGSKGSLGMPPARGFAILTCMDARLDPAKYAGLSEGDAHVIRNAGGRASDDAIRSLVISYKLLGTREWFVIHHSNCGMEFFTDDVMRGLLASSLETAALGADGFSDVGTGPGSTEGNYIDWLTISDNAQSVVDDVTRIRTHPLVPSTIPIYGYIYDVATGQLVEVPDATKAGASDLKGGAGARRRMYPAPPSRVVLAFRSRGAPCTKGSAMITTQHPYLPTSWDRPVEKADDLGRLARSVRVPRGASVDRGGVEHRGRGAVRRRLCRLLLPRAVHRFGDRFPVRQRVVPPGRAVLGRCWSTARRRRSRDPAPRASAWRCRRSSCRRRRTCRRRTPGGGRRARRRRCRPASARSGRREARTTRPH